MSKFRERGANMPHFTIPANPGLNINSVNEVLQTDPVIAEFINSYFQQFLENDQALKNMIDLKPDEVTLPEVAKTGSYSDLTDKPTIPSGAAADANIANNDTTTQSGYVADARIVKVHGDEIDALAEQAFLARYELENKETEITTGTNGGKQVMVTTEDATVITNFSMNEATKVKTIIEVIVPTNGDYKYTKTTVITPTATGKKIKESYVKEEK